MHNTFRYSENYYLRKCFLDRNQVPTQSLIREKMSPALASIYFKSMTPKLKIIAGLEPPLKGGGDNWYIPPKVLLEEGRVVLKPLEPKYMVKWNCYGMDEIGLKWIDVYRAQMKAERKKIVLDSDLAWSRKVETLVEHHRKEVSESTAKTNSEYIKAAYREFHRVFSRSITQFQDMAFDAAINKIKKYREDTYQKTQKRYEHLLHQQAIMLYDRYTKRLEKTKEELKQKFNKDLEQIRANFINKLHDIHLEKHIAIEKLRHYLECQTLACQIYVALNERMECTKQMESFERDQRKTLSALGGLIHFTDITIRLAEEKEKRQIELDKMWQKKACLVVEALQQFVSYSLKETPEQADFFINLEKLMMLQMNQVLEKPHVQSVITQDEEYSPPKAKSRPFYLFRNKRSNTSVDSALCPKGVTSSSSHMPVIVVNKQCIYSACDNFELFTDDIKDYLLAEGRFNEDLKDDHDYSVNLNVTYTASEQLRELKLESSMMQILQQEIANIRDVPINCLGCKRPHCFHCYCCPRAISPVTAVEEASQDHKRKVNTPPVGKITTRAEELKFEREPNIDTYITYVESRKCNCHKLAKNLRQSLPVYMTKASEFDTSMQNYEKCSVATLKKLVRNAKYGRKYITPVDTPEKEPKWRDKATQYTDIEYSTSCSCFTEKCIALKYDDDSNNQFVRMPSTYKGLAQRTTPSFLEKGTASFITGRVKSLHTLINKSPDLQEIYINRHCNYDL